MRKYKIATGKSRFDRRWTNTEVVWETLRDRLHDITETRETAAEYAKMGKDRQTDVKDVGGFVGGYLRDGLRKVGNVECRSLVTLDYDSFDADHLADIRGALADVKWCMHSTHKHTDTGWRVRLVIPADRDMTPDEYEAVARRIAERCGFRGIDRSTFETCRLMFWGSRSKGAPWLWEENADAEPLDVDSVLKSYRDWRDMSSWPLLPEEETAGLFDDNGGNADEGKAAAAALAHIGGKGKQEDPLEKKGIVGAWCRTYSVSEAIAKFLPDVYTRCGNRRYTHTGSTTSGGAWVVDNDRFLYSFHATDPLFGKLLNSFDLVRLAKFGDADGKAKTGTREERLPSYRAMEDFAMDDRDVRLRMMDDRRKEAAADFAMIDTEEGEPTEEAKSEWDEWLDAKATMRTDKQGNVVTSKVNVMKILGGDPRLKGKIRYNDFTGSIDVTGRLPWRRSSPAWANIDDSCLRCWLEAEYGLNGKDQIYDGLEGYANSQGYHPVKEYLESLEWDGTERLAGLFTDVLGAERTELNMELPRLFFSAAVRRIYKPGEKFDYFIILHGPEGCGKSSLFSLMGGRWFSDSVTTIEGKEGMENVQGSWIIEIGELIGVKRSENASVKSFISRETDKFRPAYGRRYEERPRQCVLVGTTNEDLFLRGINTGNRRSPVVEINPELRTVKESVREYVKMWRDQLWAEAVVLEKKGKPLMLSPELTKAAKETQDAHNLDMQNALFPEVMRFLDFYLPEDWEKKSVEERVSWIRSQNDPTSPGLFNNQLRLLVTVPEILQELFEMKRTDRDYLSRSREIGQFLNSLVGKWKMIGVRKSRIYGGQKTWKRCVNLKEERDNRRVEIDNRSKNLGCQSEEIFIRDLTDL